MKSKVFKVALTMFVMVAGLLTFATTANAGPNGVDHIGPFAASTNDGGSCGNDWAVDTYSLSLAVKDNHDGTFNLRAEYKNGSFVTIAGASPGACSSVNNHGTVVNGGISGNFQGSLSETITSSTYNPAGCAVATNCSTRTGAIASLFGPSAGQSDFSYNFEYNSNDKSLKNRHWQDRFTGSAVSDVFVGDIANQ